MDVASIFRQVFAVLLVFSLLGLTVWKLRGPGGALGWRRRAPSAKCRALQAVERLALTPQHVLHLVRMNGCEVVVATHPQGFTVLGENGGRSQE